MLDVSALPLRLLLIDESAPFRQGLARLLRVAGHTVWEGATGAAGLALLQQYPVDLVMTDQDLPGVTGGDGTRRAPATDPPLPVVRMMGGGGPSGRDGRTPGPVEALLWKPFPFADLLAVLDRLTRGTGRRVSPHPQTGDTPSDPGAARGQLRRRMRRRVAPSGR
jgi:CheY-like chemotaxis protein